MSKKVKIIATLSSLVFVLSIVVVGVIAATSTSFSIKNNISFNADNVNASVSIACVNGQAGQMEVVPSQFTINEENPAPSSIGVGEVVFGGMGDEHALIYTIVIKNLSNARNLKAEISGLPENVKIEMECFFKIDGVTREIQDFGVIYPEEEYTITVKYSLVSDSEDIDTSASLNFDLQNVDEARPSEEIVGDLFTILSYDSNFIIGQVPSYENVTLRDASGYDITSGFDIEVDSAFEINETGLKKVNVTYNGETLSFYAYWIEEIMPIERVEMEGVSIPIKPTYENTSDYEEYCNYVPISEKNYDGSLTFTLNWDASKYNVYVRIYRNSIVKLNQGEEFSEDVDFEKVKTGEISYYFIVVNHDQTVSYNNIWDSNGKIQRFYVFPTDVGSGQDIFNKGQITISAYENDGTQVNVDEKINLSNYRKGQTKYDTDYIIDGQLVKQVEYQLQEVSPYRLSFEKNAGANVWISTNDGEFEHCKEDSYELKNLVNNQKNRILIKGESPNGNIYFYLINMFVGDWIIGNYYSSNTVLQYVGSNKFLTTNNSSDLTLENVFYHALQGSAFEYKFLIDNQERGQSSQFNTNNEIITLQVYKENELFVQDSNRFILMESNKTVSGSIRLKYTTSDGRNEDIYLYANNILNGTIFYANNDIPSYVDISTFANSNNYEININSMQDTDISGYTWEIKYERDDSKIFKDKLFLTASSGGSEVYREQILFNQENIIDNNTNFILKPNYTTIPDYGVFNDEGRYGKTVSLYKGIGLEFEVENPKASLDIPEYISKPEYSRTYFIDPTHSDFTSLISNDDGSVNVQFVVTSADGNASKTYTIPVKYTDDYIKPFTIDLKTSTSLPVTLRPHVDLMTYTFGDFTIQNNGEYLMSQVDINDIEIVGNTVKLKIKDILSPFKYSLDDGVGIGENSTDWIELEMIDEGGAKYIKFYFHLSKVQKQQMRIYLVDLSIEPPHVSYNIGDTNIEFGATLGDTNIPFTNNCAIDMIGFDTNMNATMIVASVTLDKNEFASQITTDGSGNVTGVNLTVSELPENQGILMFTTFFGEGAGGESPPAIGSTVSLPYMEQNMGQLFTSSVIGFMLQHDTGNVVYALKIFVE